MKLLPAMAAAVLFSGFCATLLAYQGLIFEDDDEPPMVEPLTARRSRSRPMNRIAKKPGEDQPSRH